MAIVGGSGAGKTWLADQLQRALGRHAERLSLDDFYRDRSHLPMARRARLNYDHPRAIDWPRLEAVLRACLAGQSTEVPCYDFATHSRRLETKTLRPAPILLLDGLWLLRRPALRRLFALRLFLECPAQLRLRRRLARDQQDRGRTTAAIRQQFRHTVEPMHQRFVASQARWADLVIQPPCGADDLARILGLLRQRALKKEEIILDP